MPQAGPASPGGGPLDHALAVPIATFPLVAGIDGCRGGWVVVIAGARPGDAGPVDVQVAPTVGDLLGRLDRAPVQVAAIDMPIGLPLAGPRRCDREARALLGPRRSSVFPAPVRAALGAPDHTEARRRSRLASGRALSIQTFNLLARIAELDRATTPDRWATVVESHPELAFLRLADGQGLPPKRTGEGRDRRCELSRRVLGDVDLPAVAAAAGAPLGDVLDAVALVATARRLAAGTAELLGGGEREPDGRPMQIAW
jgi:predicted RNase H-like nuclease